ncbi:hypothetical protein L3i22_008140 [Actinoplanes sp. L3-i22]|nr:hypothetical protein L3i22_008140 [Actinoplanes sp. L3-i22]
MTGMLGGQAVPRAPDLPALIPAVPTLVTGVPRVPRHAGIAPSTQAPPTQGGRPPSVVRGEPRLPAIVAKIGAVRGTACG